VPRGGENDRQSVSVAQGMFQNCVEQGMACSGCSRNADALFPTPLAPPERGFCLHHTMPTRSGDGGGKNIPDDAVHRGSTAVRVTPLSCPAHHTSSNLKPAFLWLAHTHARTTPSPRLGLLEGDAPADGAAIEVGADLKATLPHVRLQAQTHAGQCGEGPGTFARMMPSTTLCFQSNTAQLRGCSSVAAEK